MKNLNTIVPFYDAVSEQYRYRDDQQITRKQLRLVCSTLRLLPFTIRRATSAGVVANLLFRIYKVSDGTLAKTATPATHLTITTGSTYDYINYVANADFATALPYGEYYVRITDEFPTPDVDYYSDVFMVVSAVTDYIKVEFWDDEQLNNIPASFHQYLYIDNSYKTPDYIREEEGEKIDGILLKQKQTTQKVLNLYNLLTPEFMLDSLMTLPMIDNVNVTDLLADCMTPLEVRLRDPEWFSDLGGAYAKLDIQFVEWIVIKKGGYKEVNCNCGNASNSIINAGDEVLTGMVNKVVTFTTPFVGINYGLTVRCYDDNGNWVAYNVNAHTTSYFAITAIEDATIDWIAVEE